MIFKAVGLCKTHGKVPSYHVVSNRVEGFKANNGFNDNRLEASLVR